MDFLQKEVNRFGVNATLRQLKDYHSSLRVKKPQQLRFLNKQTMRFGMYSNIAGTITRRKPHLSKKLDQHLVRLIKHYQRNPRDNMRTYTAKNIMPEYIPNEKAVINRLLNSVYRRDCDANCAVQFVLNSNEIYDLFHTDPNVMQSSIALADSFFKSKGIATSSEGTLMAGALLLQLIMMGARLTQQGYGGHNLIVEIKKEKGKQKKKKTKTPVHCGKNGLEKGGGWYRKSSECFCNKNEVKFLDAPGTRSESWRCKPKSKSSDKAEQIELDALQARIEEIDSDERAKDALMNLDLGIDSDESW